MRYKKYLIPCLKNLRFLREFGCIMGLIICSSCSKETSDSQVISYMNLRPEIRNTFDSIYNIRLNSINWNTVVAIDIKDHSQCQVYTPYLNILSNKFNIKSNQKTFRTSLDYIDRFFVIDNDTIYAPLILKPRLLKLGDPYNSNLKLDTVKFIKYYGDSRMPKPREFLSH